MTEVEKGKLVGALLSVRQAKARFSAFERTLGFSCLDAAEVELLSLLLDSGVTPEEIRAREVGGYVRH